MNHSLTPHPDTPCNLVSGIDVDVQRPRPSELRLRYIVNGKLSDIRIPAVTTPGRADELWKHTCFEVFVRGPSGDGYCELNFAPSTKWAAYAFTGYRSGMRAAEELSVVAVATAADDNHLELSVSLDLHRTTGLPADERWRLGLSAVIEEMNGRKSYWALAHPRGKPDFHHSDCFVLWLPAASHA